MPSLLRDLRLAARRLSRAPGLVAIVLLTVGAGTGANAVVVSAARTLLFDPPPGVADPERLVRAYGIDPRGGYRGVTLAAVARLDSSALVEDVAAVRDLGQVIVDIGPQLADVTMAAVSRGGFETLGLAPAAGRLFRSTDDPGRVAVISHALWAGNTRTQGRVEVGDTIDVPGRSLEIIGVLPPRFAGLQFGVSAGIWTLMGDDARASGAIEDRLYVVARVGDATPDARLALEAALAPIEGDVAVLPFSRLDPGLRPRVARIAMLLFGATLLVLFVACVNAAAMVLSRGMARARELAIRQAIGAGRRHLVRELLAESVCLAAGAAGVGLLFAFWASAVVPAQLGLDRDAMPIGSATVLGAVGVAVLLAGGLLSIGPLIQGLRPANLGALRGEGGAPAMGTHGMATRATLVVTQVALSSVLLVLSIVLTSTLRDALWAYPTVPIRDFAAISVRTYQNLGRMAELGAIAADLDPVRDGAWIQTPPLGRSVLDEFLMPGPDGEDIRRDVPINVVSMNYFELAGMPVLDGRGFLPGDTFRAPLVAVVNDVMARVMFDGNAVGRRLESTAEGAFTVVGVVGSPRHRTLEGPARPMIYYSMQQMPDNLMVFVAPTAGGAAEASRAIAAAWAALERPPVVESVSTMETRLSSSLPADRLVTSLLQAATILALALITVGVYGVMADTVARRQREIGVCAALGAGPSRIVALAMSGGMRLAGLGVAAGLLAGAGAWQVLHTMLEGTSPIDAKAFLATAGVVLVLSLVAALMPAQRALRVSPLVVMRSE